MIAYYKSRKNFGPTSPHRQRLDPALSSVEADKLKIVGETYVRHLKQDRTTFDQYKFYVNALGAMGRRGKPYLREALTHYKAKNSPTAMDQQVISLLQIELGK